MREIPFRRTTISKTNKVYKVVSKVWHLVLAGRVLVIDPSTGSMSFDGGSLPGYAVYIGGALIDSGVIQVPTVKDKHARLWEIGRSLREDFHYDHELKHIPWSLWGEVPTPSWDVLVIEDVAAKRWIKGKGGRMFGSARQQAPLHRAIGAVHASVEAKHVVEVHPGTWHTVAPDGYIKTDEGDALCMGELVRQYACHFRDRTQDKLLSKTGVKEAMRPKRATWAKKKKNAPTKQEIDVLDDVIRLGLVEHGRTRLSIPTSKKETT